MSVVAMAALVLGFAAFTALGVGDEDAPDPVRVPALAAAPARPAESNALRPEHPPIAPRRFRRPIASYRRYALRQTRVLRAAALRLRDAPDRHAARAAWRDALAAYVRLGAAYGALGSRIIGPLLSLQRGLWGRGPVRAGLLVRRVGQLPRVLARQRISPLDFSLRAHEILEDAQRDFLGSPQLEPSGAGVLATGAATDATQVVLRTLGPLLANSDPSLPARAAVARLHRTLATLHDPPTLRDRERLNGSLGAALERLALLPEELATRAPVPLVTVTP